MTTIAALFYIEVDGISARREVLGRSLTIRRAPTQFRIDFPTAPDCWTFARVGIMAPADATPDPRDYEPTTALLEQGADLVSVRLLQVVGNTQSTLSVAAFDPNLPADAEAYQQLLLDLWTGAEAIVGELCERLKLDLGQHWIEPAGKYPRSVNLAELIDVDANLTFGSKLGRGLGSLRVLDPATVLGADSLAELEVRLGQGQTQTDELLLAEARYVLDSEQAVAFDRSTLLAAIAVELRTKRLLRALAGQRHAAMLELLIANPRDWSMSVHGLFLRAVPTLAGSDLGDTHKNLARRLQRLFNTRNAIAHGGSTVDKDVAVEHVQTAIEAFAFMDAIPLDEG